MPIRPPPLKLKYDNRFPLPIPSAKKAPVEESFFAKLYKANWRNLVIAVAGLNVLRYAYAAYTAYTDAEVDQFEHASELAMVSIALCVMYGSSVIIELFGAIGISTRRFGFVRAYVLLAFVSATIVTAASVLKTASFFLNAEELMYECVALALTGQVYQKSQFHNRPWPGFTAGLRHAQKQCVAAWTQESWSQIICVFLFGFMPSLIHYLMVYTYYRQTTDADHSAYMAPRKLSCSARPQQRNGDYARVANNESDALYAGAAVRVETVTTTRTQRSARHRPNATQRAAGMTVVAPATSQYSTRGIVRTHRPPALVSLEPAVFSPQRGAILQSAAALSAWLSPGPPTYGAHGRQQAGARVGGVLLGCGGSGLSARYGKFV
jgi:hypothetical protein